MKSSLVNDSQREIAKQNGLSYLTVYKRIVEYGWDAEKAITTPTGQRFGNPNSRFTDEELKIAESNGISYSALCNRMKKGWDRQQALVTPPLNRHDRQGFRSLWNQYKDRCEALGISQTAFYKRVKKMTPEEAVSFPPVPRGGFRGSRERLQKIGGAI